MKKIHNVLKQLLGLSTLLWIAACSTQTWLHSSDYAQGQALSNRDFILQGRIFVRSEQGGISGKVEWVSRLDAQLMTLTSPLGNTMAQLEESHHLATLKILGRDPLTAPSATTLTLQYLGYPIPVEGLHWWIQGLSAPGSAAKRQVNEEGQLQDLTQEGWHIHYALWRQQDSVWIPERLDLTYQKDLIKLRIDHWQWLSVPHG